MTIATQSSRDPNLLHPKLLEAWNAMLAEWQSVHPSLPVPFITQTARSAADQNADYARGRTAPGKVITNAKAGQSLHNYEPALAFDVAFKNRDGSLAWDSALFTQLGLIGTKHGLMWGGNYRGSFKDLPHYEPPHYTWEMAAKGTAPTFSNLA